MALALASAAASAEKPHQTTTEELHFSVPKRGQYFLSFFTEGCNLWLLSPPSTSPEEHLEEEPVDEIRLAVYRGVCSW